MMTKTNHKKIEAVYYNEDTRLALLEQSIGHINESLLDIKGEIKAIHRKFDKFEDKFQAMDDKFQTMNDKMNDKIDTHFRTNVYMILGLYGTVIATFITVLSKMYH